MLHQISLLPFFLISAILHLNIYAGYKSEEKASLSINSNSKHCFDVALYQPSEDQKDVLRKALQGACKVLRSDDFYSLIGKREWHTGRTTGRITHRMPEVIDSQKVIEAVKQQFELGAD